MQVMGGGFGPVGPVLLLVVWALAAFALYWVVRLAVRHGTTDADRRAASGGALAGPPTT